MEFRGRGGVFKRPPFKVKAVFFPLLGEIAMEKRCTSLGYFSLGYHICGHNEKISEKIVILLDVQDVRNIIRN